MFYPEDFKTRVKNAYPNDERLHRLLDNGDKIVGRILDDGAIGSLSLNTILTATSLEDLQDKARALLEKKELYSEWCQLLNKENSH